VTSAAPQDYRPTTGESIDVARALDALPSEQREVVTLHVVEGFSFREIGGLTGVSMFTAAARYRLAIGKLREALVPNASEAKETT
jgi:DNA-directed RNA polymerase specialized sigma24 family protein